MERYTRWWLQRFLIFTPKIGEMIQFDDHIFQMGWFNHHLTAGTPQRFKSLQLTRDFCEGYNPHKSSTYSTCFCFYRVGKKTCRFNSLEKLVSCCPKFRVFFDATADPTGPPQLQKTHCQTWGACLVLLVVSYPWRSMMPQPTSPWARSQQQKSPSTQSMVSLARFG